MKRILLIVLGCLAIVTVKAQIVINEVCPANADINYDPQFYNFSPWIELYNAGNSSVNLNGYYVTDDPANKTKYRLGSVSIAAKGYLLVWCDDMNQGVHTNFSLDSEGESVVISNGSGTILDQVQFPEQYTNVSYGRVSNGATWGYLSSPSPGAQNTDATGTKLLKKPVFSIQPGRYSGALNITITNETSDAIIRYTTDGSEPTEASTQYTAPVSIPNTKVLKARAFKTGSLPSLAATATYFINEHTFTIPVVSISTRGAYLNDNTIGIYVSGSNGVTANCSDGPKNWNRDWDRHAVIEYFNTDGSRKFDQHVDMRLGGACSRNLPQKSLVIKARDKYGSNVIKEKLFPNKESNEYGGFILRNSGNDFNVTSFRDALSQALVKDQMDIDYLDYQPTVLYLNGQYWGIQDMREKIDADYIESNFGVDKDDLDLLETYENALEGTSDKYISYRTTLGSMDRSTPAAYEYMSENIDVQEYINYLVTEIYLANTDWPGNNMKFWRQRSTNGKFRWILWDLDFSFALFDWNAATHPTLDFATDTQGPSWPNPPWSTLHIRLALNNPQFREQFIHTFNTALNTTFATDRVVQMINQFQTRIATEMPYHKTRWGGNISDFNFEVQRLRDFAASRNAFMKQHLRNFFGLPDEYVSLSVSSSPVNGGRFKVNGITIDEADNASYFKGQDYTVQAIAAPGYKFKAWNVTKRESAAVPMIARGATWRYFDQAGSPGANWNADVFDDATWSTGTAQFGYGEGDEQTVIGYGGDVNNKNITSYYRTAFNVADTVGLQKLLCEALFDDGVVVYLNGQEVYRNNMPLGSTDFNTLATAAISVENSFFTFEIPKGIVKPGSNVVAVEVHQNAGSSSDVSFDYSMRGVRLGDVEHDIVETAVVTGEAFSDISMVATFEEDHRLITGLVINEISTMPSSHLDGHGDDDDWIEIKNNGTSAVNLAGLYLTDNVGQKKKHRIGVGSGDEMLLAPGEYKIFWADDELAQGVVHVAFKLSNDGEMVGLYQELDGEIYPLDEVYFSAQTAPGSFSRIPDGTGPITFTIQITPGATNQIVTDVEKDFMFALYPNPVSSSLVITGQAYIEQINILDGMGHVVKSTGNQGRECVLPVGDMASGLYFVRIFSNGRWHTFRVVKE